MEAVAVEGSVAALRAGVDGLFSDDLTRLDSAGLVELVRAVETQRRRLAAVDARLLAEVGQRSLNGDLGLRRVTVAAGGGAAPDRVA